MSSSLQETFIPHTIRLAEAAEDHGLDGARSLQERPHALHGDLSCLIRREAIDAGRDAREGDALQSRLGREAQGVRVAGTEFVRFAVFATVPDRADGVDDVSCFETMAFRHFRLAGAAAVQHAAFGEQIGTCRAMNRSIHAAATKQRGVGGVDDGTDGELGDVGLEDLEHGSCE